MKWKIKVNSEDHDPFLARIIVVGEWDANPKEAKRLLEDICQEWPKNKKVKFLITCGGFTQFDWPKRISREDVGDNKNPSKDYVDALPKEAEECAKSVLSNGLGEKLREFTDYVTLGIDSRQCEGSDSQPCIELVLLVDLKTNKILWTGKSYPTSNQEDELVRISDLTTHFFELESVGKAMILGCHDLNLLINRGKKTKNETWRISLRRQFQELARKEKPIEYILQHPHTSDCRNTWAAAWGAAKNLTNSKKYASAGRVPKDKHYKNGKLHCTLIDVLKSTKCGDTIDFIVRVNKEL
jgi:hypothetical protein